ncbi:MAG: response regulator [Rhodospirillales bacterium]|nr:response regulator [Rhodospirillales bacterium]
MPAPAAPQDKVRAILERLSAEFRDSCRDAMDECDAIVGRLSKPDDDWHQDMVELQRRVHNVKGSGATFGFPAISLIAHKFEDYLEGLETPAKHVRDLQVFLDAIRSIAERGTNPPEEEYPALLRSLPRLRHGFTATTPAREVHILLAMPKDVQRRIVRQELASCGFDVTCADNGVAAIGLALSTRPDAVLASLVLPDMSGVELARALAAIGTTRKFPFGLLTSLAADAPKLAGLPLQARVIAKDKRFLETLTERLIEWGLFGHVTAH